MLAPTIKLSRDDVGHGRPLRVDHEFASVNLVSLPVLAGIVDEVVGGLAQTWQRHENSQGGFLTDQHHVAVALPGSWTYSSYCAA